MRSNQQVRIHLTERAAAKIHDVTDEQTAVQLVYDAEGCGCAVSGVPQLWVIDLDKEHELEQAGDDMPLYIDPNQTVFFEPDMKLDFNQQNGLFRLASDQQIYHHALPLINKTKKD